MDFHAALDELPPLEPFSLLRPTLLQMLWQ